MGLLGIQGYFTGKTEVHNYSEGERDPGGLTGSGAHRTGQLPAVAEATQGISVLRGGGKLSGSPRTGMASDYSKPSLKLIGR